MRASDNVRELATAPLGSLLLRYSWPALVAMALNALYATVDRFYIGQGCGADAMAGMTLAMPVTMLLGAFGVWIGAGHSTVLSLKLGANDRVACEKTLGQLVAWKLLFFLVLPPLLFFFTDDVLRFCGGARVTAGAFAAARTYLRIVLFPNIFAHLAFGFSAMMRAEGAAVRSMICMVVGFGANLVLDPIFIFGLPLPWGGRLPALGIAGAAWATNVAMFLSCAWAAWFYLSHRGAVRLRLARIRFYRGLCGRAMAIGFASFLQHLMSAAICTAMTMAFTHWAVSHAEATAQIASLGVFQAVMILTFMPILGCQSGITPILGYNWGARNFARVRRALKLGFAVTTVLCILAWFVQVVPPFPHLLARIFVSADEPALVARAAHDLQVSNGMLWCISVNVIATTYFLAIGRPKMAIFLSMLRQGVILLPCIVLLPLLMSDKTFAVWLALPVSDLVCQLATLPPLLRHFRFLAGARSRKSDFHSRGSCKTFDGRVDSTVRSRVPA